MPYTLIYHPDVRNKDIPAISQNLRDRIARAIDTRLTGAPERYGKPLRATLKGYWRLRIGDYRVIFKVVRNEVWALGIVHRREVYEKILKRLVV